MEKIVFIIMFLVETILIQDYTIYTSLLYCRIVLNQWLVDLLHRNFIINIAAIH
jgi:hypothetical protein